MSDLETLRAHAREMAERKHRPDCARATGVTSLNCGNTTEHAAHHWNPTISNGRETITGRASLCYGLCFGCMDDDERAEWKRQADELGAWLDREQEEER